MKKYWKEIAAAGIVLALINMFYFLIPFQQTISLFLGDGFTCAGFGLLIYAIYLSSVREDARSRFLGWPVLRTGGWFYVSILLVNFFLVILGQFLFVPLWLQLFANLALLGVECLLLLALDSGRDFVETQKQKRDQRMAEMQQLCEKIRVLEMQCEDPLLLEAIGRLKKEFRYSDPNSSAGSIEIEEKMREELNELEKYLNTDTGKGLQSIERISRMLKFRNQQVIQGK